MLKNSDIVAAWKIIFGTADIKEATRDLEAATNSLDRCTRVVLTNRQSNSYRSSRKAAQLSKAFRRVKKFAGSLHVAISQGWATGCHESHEAKLFLEDRVNVAGDILKRVETSPSKTGLLFGIIVSPTMHQGHCLWHETAVLVLDEESGDPTVCVAGLCDMIEAAKCDPKKLALVLTEDQKIGTLSTVEGRLFSHKDTQAITLGHILSRSLQVQRGHILPLKFRMTLALSVASSLLQLTETEWLQTAWSKDAVHFMAQQTQQTRPNSGNLGIDISRPFVSLSFDSVKSNATRKDTVEPKVALLELGILLLEIWHETSLERRFSLDEPPTGYYIRLGLALEWLDDVDNPLLPLYDGPVTHCIKRVIGGGTRCHSWEDTKLNDGICQDIIQPLSAICNQWKSSGSYP